MKLCFFLILAEILTLSQTSWSQETTNDLKKRIKQEESIDNITFAITSHKPMYILPFSYNYSDPNSATQLLPDIDKLETKFQFSFKISIIESFLKDHASLQFGFTQKSFWQLFNKKASAPFRETNYEPEVFLVYNHKGLSIKNWNSSYILGFTHESNGRSAPKSRSWNRFYIQKLWDLKYLVLSSKFWYRLPEEKKSDPDSSYGDDNPDITNYLGFSEIMLLKKWDKLLFSLTARNNFRAKNRGSLEFAVSGPIYKHYKYYFQYFNGYGESLIDYNNNINRVSIGLVVNDWL